MHYRRMDPQPRWSNQPVERVYSTGHCLTNYDFVGDGRHAYDAEIRRPPADMSDARPWRAADGEWFWRRAL